MSATGADEPQVSVYSQTAWVDAEIEITGGNANGLLAFDTTPIAATGGSLLAPSTSYARYCFDLETASAVSTGVAALMRSIAEYMKPAHTHLINIRTALTPPWPDGWQIGVSELDSSTELAP